MYHQNPSQSSPMSSYADIRLPSTPDSIHSMSLPRPSNFSIENLELCDLMGNPHVRDLFRQCNEGSQQLARQAESNSQLLHHINFLQNEVFEHKQRALELQNQPISRVSTMASGATNHANITGAHEIDAFRPSIRPAHYPEKILWTFEDCVKHNLVSDSNKSRPNMKKCVRDQNGELVEKSTYSTIKGTARLYIFQDLFTLPTPADPAAKAMSKTKTYYQRYHPNKYREVLKKLEDSEPLLKLCAPHWKADQIILQTLTSIIEKGSKSEKAGKRKRNTEADSSEDEDESAKDKQVRSVKKTRAQERSDDSSRSQTPQTPLSEQLLTLGTATSSVQVNVSSRAVVAPVASGGNSTDGIATSIPVPDSRPRPRIIDVDYIVVDPSVSSLRSELASLIPSVGCAVDLLDAMDKHPTHFNGQPSTSLSSLISTIEAANPNAPDVSEDESNANWGHRQLSGAWQGIITDWECVGTCNAACHLISAVVKTCKVARQLCFERQVETYGYLCDAYLEQIIEKLWDCWKRAGGPVIKGKAADHQTMDNPVVGNPAAANEEDTGDSGTQTIATTTVSAPGSTNPPTKIQIEKLLSILLIEDLKTWTEKFNVALASKKRKPSKDDYKTAILASPLSSSKDGYAELQTLSQARKASKKKKTPE